MSLSGRRLAATLGALWVLALATIAAHAGTLPDSTWVALRPLPQQGHSAIFGLAVDPTNNQALIAASSAGALLRSVDGGATWKSVHGGAVADTIAFDPNKPTLVLAGTRSGALVSHDSGQTWSAATGLEHRTVRAFAFALAAVFAGTDHGVYASTDAGASSWTAAGLSSRDVNTLAVEAIHAPVHLVAASDSAAAGAGPQLFQSNDGAATWTPFTPAISGTFAVKLAVAPLPPSGSVRPLLVGTNAGLFASTDNGATFTTLSGAELLPSTDYTLLEFINQQYNRFYAGSDGGGSGGGGLWRSDDGGQTFRSLAPPMPSISALAVSSGEAPVLYVAAFRPSDHLAALWAYHDTGGAPQGPPVTPSPVASGGRLASADTGFRLQDLIRASQTPYVALGVVALLVIATAAVAHLRGRRR